MVHRALVVGLMLLAQSAFDSEPVVRIGIERDVASVTLESAALFTIEGRRVRSASFSAVVILTGTGNEIRREDIERRMAIELDAGIVLVRSMDARVGVEPGREPLRVSGRTFRGSVEVRGIPSGAFTIVNELPLEEYLLGVVPNELGPETFPELEALKAQAVAARTYVVRNLGQFADEGFDICATDQCQVYRGLDTEHPLATRAVEETRGLIATYDREPINALYSSTCGGRTESAENVFGQAVPYLVSTTCHYEHPAPQPFASSVSYATWEEGLLGIAGVRTFSDAGRFLGIPGVGEPAETDAQSLARFIKRHFFPDVPAPSDRAFLEEQGVLLPGGPDEASAILLRLLLRKDAFEWQDARLISWDGEVLRARVGASVEVFRLRPDAAIFRRIGESRVSVDQGAWIGGESLEIRASDGVIDALVYRSNPASSADRYSPLARWQTHRTREELETAIRPLRIGGLEDIIVLERGQSDRVVRVEIRGTSGRRVVSGPRLRTLLGLRDSLVFMDEERNRDRELLGISFFGSGWGHGVGLCQVGAYGMAMDGATVEEILKTYYRGIELERVF